MATSAFDHVVEQFERALDEFFRGNPEPAKVLMSHGDDVTLGNPFGPFVRGWKLVNETMDRAGSNYRDGAAAGFELVAKYVTPDLAYAVWVERFESKVGGNKEITSGALRRTTIFRREHGAWRIVHTQADSVTTTRAAESIVPK